MEHGPELEWKILFDLSDTALNSRFCGFHVSIDLICLDFTKTYFFYLSHLTSEKKQDVHSIQLLYLFSHGKYSVCFVS